MWFYSSWRTFKIRRLYRMCVKGQQIISRRGKCHLLMRQLLLHSPKMNFCQSITATWFSDVPSLSIASTIIPLHLRLQSSASHHRLWWLNLWRGLWGFILELGWSQRNVPKTTLDIWYLKMILTEFRTSRPTASTSVMMQLTCIEHKVSPLSCMPCLRCRTRLKGKDRVLSGLY